ncbi:hypothetical protein [Vulcanisaeta sp. JCM 14467]
MGLLRTIGLVFLGIFLAFFILIIIAGVVYMMTHPQLTNQTLGIMNQTINQTQSSTRPPPNPMLITNAPAGVEYVGPPTDALAAYYCVYQARVASDGSLVNGAYVANSSVYSPPGYSVQLNVELSNGYTAQNAWGFPHFDGNVLRGISVGGTVWSGNGGVLHFRIGPPVPDCGWLIIGINGSTLYFEYSVDGKSINWYYGYSIGSNASIVPGVETNLIIAGPTNGADANFTSLYVVLTLYYWNDTAWVPAPVEAVSGAYYTGFVTNAWVFTGRGEAVVSWPNAVNSSAALPTVEPPSFTPETPPNPVLIINRAAGVTYDGPSTTALAGYYCVYVANVSSDGWMVNGVYQPNASAYLPPGYGVQLNAELSNSLWIQDVYGGAYTTTNGALTSINVDENVWSNNTLLSLKTGPAAQPCGWLIMRVVNGTAYFGYSSNGESVDWYYTYPVGNATIVPSHETNLVIAGPGNSAGVNFTRLYAVLALYYWNGTAWAPAPVVVEGGGTGEFTLRAWVYANQNEAIVSYPRPANSTMPMPPVKPPSINPFAPPNPAFVTYQPVGVSYDGPQTTALAGYYCVYRVDVASDGWLVNGVYEPNSSAYFPPGYTVQLNAQLSNGYSLEDAWGFSYNTVNGVLESINVSGEVLGSNGQLLSSETGPAGGDCGWFVISIEDGTVYLGYSSNGKSVDWFMSYTIGSNTVITPGAGTSIAISGPATGAGVDFRDVYAVLALYYWNGTAWAQAPVRPGVGPVSGWVMNAWIYTSGNEAVISWPQPTNSSTAMPGTEPPSFTP